MRDRAEQGERIAREWEQRYRLVVDQIVDYAIFSTDVEGRATTWNKGVERILGFDEHAFIGQDITEAIFTTDAIAAGVPEKELSEAAREGSADNDRWMRRRNGERFFANGVTTAQHDEAGRLIGFTKILRDGTERRLAEEALRASEDRYRNLFNSVDEGYCIIEVLFDERQRPVDYRFIEVNPAFERHTGIRNAAGRRMREIAPGHEPHWFEIYGQIALTGEPQRFEQRAEALGRCYDVYAFRIGAPQERRVAILFNDITDRKRAEEALRYRSAQYQTLLDRAPIGVYLVDADFRLREINPAARPVFSSIPAPIDRDFEEIIHILWEKDEADEVVRIFRETLRTGEPYVNPEWARPRRDLGVMEYYEWRIDRITLPDGRNGAVCYFRNISERKQAEIALRRSEEQFRRAIEEAPIPVIMHAEDGQVLQISRSWTELTGYTLEDAPVIQRWLTLAYGHGGDDILAAVKRLFESDDQIRRPVEFEITTRGGKRRSWSFSASSPGTLADGRRFIVGMAQDITERKRHQEQMTLVMAELNHRVKNTLAVVSAMARQTLRNTPDIEHFQEAFDDRLSAIAAAHTLLTSADWRGASLREIIASELRARAASGAQYSLSGPEIQLRPKLALAMHMIVHELTTNAVKYGALSCDQGRIDIRWNGAEQQDPSSPSGAGQFTLDWTEHCGRPLPEADAARLQAGGFGSRLIHQLVEYELAGDVHRELSPDGVHYRIRARLPDTAAAHGA